MGVRAISFAGAGGDRCGQKVKGIYVQQIVELLNLEEWSDDDTKSEEPAD